MNRPHVPTYNLLQDGAAYVLELNLRIDVESEVFDDIHARLLDAWPVPAGSACVIDLSRCEYFGSVLLGLLVSVRQKVRAGRGRFGVCHVSPRLLQVMRAANLDRLVPVFPNRAAALKAAGGT
jgi:anti-anti-sigma factor